MCKFLNKCIKSLPELHAFCNFLLQVSSFIQQILIMQMQRIHILLTLKNTVNKNHNYLYILKKYELKIKINYSILIVPLEIVDEQGK